MWSAIYNYFASEKKSDKFVNTSENNSGTIPLSTNSEEKIDTISDNVFDIIKKHYDVSDASERYTYEDRNKDNKDISIDETLGKSLDERIDALVGCSSNTIMNYFVTNPEKIVETICENTESTKSTENTESIENTILFDTENTESNITYTLENISPNTNDSGFIDNLDTLLQKLKNGDPEVIRLYRVNNGLIRVQQDKTNIHDSRITLYDTSLPNIKMPVFQHEIIIVEEWDRNGVFLNLNPKTFPNAKIIVLLSDPGESSVLWRSNKWTWFSMECYKEYFNGHTNKIIFTQESELLRLLMNFPAYTANLFITDDRENLLQRHLHFQKL